MKSPERKFLHDLATPMGALYIVLHSLVEDARDVPDSPYLERLERCYKLSKRLNELLVERREQVQATDTSTD